LKPKETNSKKKIEDLDAVKDSATGKKKPGRKSNAELEAAKRAEEQELLGAMPDSDTFEGMLEYLFNVLATRLGPQWALTDDEKSKGSVLVNNVAAKYFPLIGEYGPEVALLLWVAPVVLLRVQITVALQEKAAAAGNGKQEDGKKTKASVDG